ncbi:STAS domain-containing protein [Streptomyces virginiae]
MQQQVTVLPYEGGIRVIVCEGDFDRDTLQPLIEAGTAAAADPDVTRIILDVSQVAFADFSMLNLMVRLLRSGRLVLVGSVPHRLDRLLEPTQARDLFPTAENVAAARIL